jgi:hypothetical protein
VLLITFASIELENKTSKIHVWDMAEKKLLAMGSAKASRSPGILPWTPH